MSGDIVTLLSADLVSSNASFEQPKRDTDGLEQPRYLKLLRDAVADAGGHEVAHPGDDLTAVFDSAVRAVECAIAMERAFDLQRRRPRAPRLEVRVGLHVSESAGEITDLAGLLPTVGALRAGNATVDTPRLRLLGGLAAVLARLSDSAPVVVVLDDVHLADNSSWEALNFLTRNLNDSRLLVVLAARPVELADHHMASDVLHGLEQEGLLRRHTVSSLSSPEIQELPAIFIDGRAPDALVDWIMERSQGSPLFASGLLRALIDEGADLEHPHLESLPEDLAQRVSGRLQHFESQSRALLEMLSVLGYRVELNDLVRVSGRSLDELAPTLERLTRERVVSEDEQRHELTSEVTHPLIQEPADRDLRHRPARAHVRTVVAPEQVLPVSPGHPVAAAGEPDVARRRRPPQPRRARRPRRR